MTVDEDENDKYEDFVARMMKISQEKNEKDEKKEVEEKTNEEDLDEEEYEITMMRQKRGRMRKEREEVMSHRLCQPLAQLKIIYTECVPMLFFCLSDVWKSSIYVITWITSTSSSRCWYISLICSYTAIDNNIITTL